MEVEKLTCVLYPHCSHDEIVSMYLGIISLT